MLYEKFPVYAGRNAFEVMEEKVPVTYTKFIGVGLFIESIGNVSPSQGEYLALYINGEYAPKGIDRYTITRDLNITWKVEAISASPLS